MCHMFLSFQCLDPLCTLAKPKVICCTLAAITCHIDCYIYTSIRMILNKTIQGGLVKKVLKQEDQHTTQCTSTTLVHFEHVLVHFIQECDDSQSEVGL